LSVAALSVAALAGSLLWVAPAQAAEVAEVPQAPVISVISARETIPFTRVGGAPTQVAVLTGEQTVADATWTTIDELSLAAYEGQTIRVLARAEGVGDPEQYFDATYDVRDTYESAVGHGTEANPVEAVPAGSPRITGWATGYADYLPGDNVADNWKTPLNAVGSIAGHPDDPYSGNTTVVVLGDHGRITMTFDNPIIDGPGYDFAVFENGFNVGTTSSIFGELGRVQVSSNGTDFVEFDTGTLHDQPVGGYAGFPADLYGGTAGRDLNGHGTPYDLAALRNKPEVRSGAVDLDRITAVKIVDIVGDGNDLDSFGRPIYEAFPTFGSGGFDLRAVGVMNQQRAALNPTRAVGIDTTTVGVSTSVSTGNDGGHVVQLEIADDEDGTNPRVVDSGVVAAGEQGKPFDFRVRDVAAEATFWYRVVLRNGDADVAASTEWKSFTKTPSQVALSSNPSCSRIDNAARCSFVGTYRTNSDGPFVRWVELSEAADHSDAWVVGRTETQSGQILAEGADALELGRTYWYRYVAEHADGVRRASEWGTVTAAVAPSALSPALVSRKGGQITFTSEVRPGSDTAAKVSWQYATNSAFTTGVGTLPQVSIPSGKDSSTYTRTISGLDPSVRHYVRAVVERDNAVLVNSSSLNVAPEAAPVASILNVVLNTANGQAATVQSRLSTHTYGQQSSTIEWTSDPARHDVEVSEPVLTTSTANNASLTGLAPGTTYWVRGVWRSTAQTADGHVAASDWFEFTTPALSDALDGVGVEDVTRTAAQVSASVAPGVFARRVRVAYRAAGGETLHTAAQDVPFGAAAELPFSLDELAPNTEYTVWAESTVPGTDLVEESGRQTFTTAKSDAVLGEATASGLSHVGATVSATLTPGDVGQAVWVEYSFAQDGADAVRTAAVDVEAGDAPVAVSFELSGLAAGRTVRFRVVAAAVDGDRVSTDWSSFTTAVSDAPTVSVSVPDGEYRVGDTVTVSWTAVDADSLVASGDWSGELDPAGGSREVTLDRDGAYRFTATADGPGGRAEVTSTVVAALAATDLTLTVRSGPAKVGSTVKLAVVGLADGEDWTATIGGVQVASGTAGADGGVIRSVTVPRVLADARQQVRVTGSVADRTGVAPLRVVRANRLPVSVSKNVVPRGRKLRVTVRGLAARESVTVRVLGRTFKGTGNVKGVFRTTFKVTQKNAKKLGRKKVTVQGLDKSRQGNTTFRVRRR
jgi:hypothetical protein